MARTIIIGDIHGCSLELATLLNHCGYIQNCDRLISVGDVINKGPDSKGCLELLAGLNAEIVVGNHELTFLKDFDTEKRPWVSEIKRQFGAEVEIWRNRIQAWPKYIESETFLVVHGGLVPGLPPEKASVELLSTIRTWDGVGVNLCDPNDPAWHELYSGSKLVVYGHWATAGLTVKERTIGLDSGCVYGKQLTALILPGRHIVQVPAKRAYRSIT